MPLIRHHIFVNGSARRDNEAECFNRTLTQGANLSILMHSGASSPEFHIEPNLHNEHFWNQLFAKISTFLVYLGYGNFELPAHKQIIVC